MKKSNKKIGMCCIGTIFVVALGVNVAFSTCSFRQICKLNDKLEQSLEKDEDVAQEDNVMIGDVYEIKSTKYISDAYKDGKTDVLNSTDKETLNMASEVLKSVIKDGMSDYEKELAVYDWIVTNIKTDDSVTAAVPNATTRRVAEPNGVLKNKKAICVGYATTFRLFMQMLNIDCKVVHSTDRGHSWDMVKLDGEWYHTDTYMDAGSMNFANFNMDDKRCQMSHDWNQEFFPAAVGVKYNYAYMNNEPLDDIYKVPKNIRKAIKDKKKYLFYNLGKNATDETKGIAENMVTLITNYISSDYDISCDWIQKSKDDDLILCIYLNSYSDSSEIAISDKELKKINKEVDKAFSDYTSRNKMDY